MSAPDRLDAMAEVVSGLKTKADKIRTLDRAGYGRAEIARFLDIRYQHVRNVLVQAQEQSAAYVAPAPNAKEWLQVRPDGRMVIPASYRRLLGIERGGDVLATIKDGTLTLVSHARAMADLQAKAAPYAAAGSLTDALIAERRREARKESPE